MQYCKRCCYPANTKPVIIFDEEGVCSGCRLIESRGRLKIDWEDREKWFRELVTKYKAIAKERGNAYDCIVPVSGGKDSLYQVHLAKKLYGLNPLLVTFNHIFNTKTGIYNLQNMVKKLNCDLLRFTPNEDSVKKISWYMTKTIGDCDWHAHAGITTWPIRAAVLYNIPLIVWGEHGFAEMFGMHNMDDMVEFTKKKRREHDMRGYEPEDLTGQDGITEQDVAPYHYPTDEDIERVGVRGIFLSNYFNWDAKTQVEEMIKTYGFRTADKKDRTYNMYDKLDGFHQCGTHDYMKYLKFGYGRCTDDVSMDIRHGRITREQGIELVKQYDHVRPFDLDIYLKWINKTEKEFVEALEPMRDPRIWEKGIDGQWKIKDSIFNHVNDPGVDEVRLPLSGQRQEYVPNLPPYYWDSDIDYIIL